MSLDPKHLTIGEALDEIAAAGGIQALREILESMIEEEFDEELSLALDGLEGVEDEG